MWAWLHVVRKPFLPARGVARFGPALQPLPEQVPATRQPQVGSGHPPLQHVVIAHRLRDGDGADRVHAGGATQVGRGWGFVRNGGGRGLGRRLSYGLWCWKRQKKNDWNVQLLIQHLLKWFYTHPLSVGALGFAWYWKRQKKNDWNVQLLIQHHVKWFYTHPLSVGATGYEWYWKWQKKITETCSSQLCTSLNEFGIHPLSRGAIGCDTEGNRQEWLNHAILS